MPSPTTSRLAAFVCSLNAAGCLHRGLLSSHQRPSRGIKGPKFSLSGATVLEIYFLVKDSRYSTSFLEPMKSGTRW